MPALADGVQAIGRGGDGRESDLVEAQVVLQVAIDAPHVGDAGGERDARGDRARAVAASSSRTLRRDDVVAAAAVGEDPQRVVHLRRTIHADGHADAVLRQELR